MHHSDDPDHFSLSDLNDADLEEPWVHPDRPRDRIHSKDSGHTTNKSLNQILSQGVRYCMKLSGRNQEYFRLRLSEQKYYEGVLRETGPNSDESSKAGLYRQLGRWAKIVKANVEKYGKEGGDIDTREPQSLSPSK